MSESTVSPDYYSTLSYEAERHRQADIAYIRASRACIVEEFVDIEVSPCEGCGKESSGLFLFNDFSSKHLCEDCWVIKYDRGR